MRILALETTERCGSVAAAIDDKLLAELKLEPTARTAQSLAPAIVTLLEQVGWQPHDVELVAVSRGPGSFTGLRIGLTVAKVFAYAVKAEILGIDTLEAIAAAAPAEVAELSAAIDAQRGQVAVRDFARQADGWLHPLGPDRLVDVATWWQALPQGAIVTGPALGKLADRLPAHVHPLDPAYWPARASTVAQLAARDHRTGRCDDLWRLLPHYSRKSAAEEKAGL
jgi:tRNA threonylcarbamoyladenosine biosynthesis protein TsaB